MPQRRKKRHEEPLPAVGATPKPPQCQSCGMVFGEDYLAGLPHNYPGGIQICGRCVADLMRLGLVCINDHNTIFWNDGQPTAGYSDRSEKSLEHGGKAPKKTVN